VVIFRIDFWMGPLGFVYGNFNILSHRCCAIRRGDNHKTPNSLDKALACVCYVAPISREQVLLEVMAMEDGRNAVSGLAGVVIAGVTAWYFFGGGFEHQAAKDMGEIEQKVATDSVTEYGIAKRNGNSMDACVQAGLVAAAFLQAKDEASYRQWKDTETADCKVAGVPQ
jgi:hypothetical protein